jgi:hypothetical protein
VKSGRIFRCALVLGALAFGQEQPPVPARTTSKVSGRFVNVVSGEPVRKVALLLQPRDREHGEAYWVEADSNGYFVVDDVQPGVYSPNLLRTGFMIEEPGARHTMAEPLTVLSGQDLTGLTIRLIPLGVITGRLLEEDGDPMAGATVEVLEEAYVEGKKQLIGWSQVRSNVKGDFRIWDVHPGTVYLRAQNNAMFQTQILRGFVAGFKREAGYTSTYYPSTIDPTRAAPIVVAPGAHVKGIDIQLRRERLYVVRGKNIFDTARQLSAQMVPLHGDLSATVHSPLLTRDTFEFHDLQPGSYVIVASRMDGEKKRFAREPVEIVDADVDGVTLTFGPGADVAGIVRIEGKLPAVPGLTVTLQPVAPSMFSYPIVQVKADGSFTLLDTPPGIYEVKVEGMQASYLKSMRLGDQEINDRLLDLTKGTAFTLVVILGMDVGKIEGKVLTAKGGPAVRIQVTCVPYGDQARGDFFRIATTDEKGSFRMPNVPPGKYKIFAWEDAPVGGPQAAEFRKRYEKQGVALKMIADGHQTVELTAISVGKTQ